MEFIYKFPVFRSRMLSLLGDVKGLIKLDKLCIDNNVFRLHYKVRDATKECEKHKKNLSKHKHKHKQTLQGE